MTDIRKERVGITHAARLLNVSVRELKSAVQQGTNLRGYPAPTPIARGQGKSMTQMTFYLGGIMDLAEKLGE